VKTTRAWGVVDARSGNLLLWSGTVPVYWRKSTAVFYANDHGYTVTGRNPKARIVRVDVVAAPKKGRP
jgi:hypothetical protein